MRTGGDKWERKEIRMPVADANNAEISAVMDAGCTLLCSDGQSDNGYWYQQLR